MYLKKLVLQKFRNIQEQEISFHPHFNLIIGKNAQGKTNILESVYYLGFLNSFRASLKRELITKDEHEAFMECELSCQDIDHVVRILIGDRSRKVSLDGKQANLYKDYYGLVPILLFEPRDVYIFRDSPSQRRKFLSRALFLDNPSVLKTIRDYEKIVSQKNRLLKEVSGGALMSQLEVWNEQLGRLGAQLVYERLLWIQSMNQILPQEYNEVSQKGEMFHLNYVSKTPYGPSDQEFEEQVIYKILMDHLNTAKSEEVRRREAVVGPHRDDWVAYLDDREVGTFGSQGENRSAIIALKSAQVHLFEKKHHYPPIFLLDDVASELDNLRQEALFSYLRKTNGQVFLTTTEPDQLERYFKGDGASFLVEDGKVRVLGSGVV